ncbi:YihY/virulence factor BrkB family protein [Candidatus Cetobacterium colombiensis]|uniref:YihY/virulence factor BrkB family protein n=1 Tax=Candidatus Cetobacterium colombiensis TaxID=3073100 RepID=A0ABU4W9U5_9FUSO|nr:YihY/virulence factor BrkB family protein [Candidatus Cetobacterium colombiensis]MDX8335469.1 YihY/virulence factor BrkB family protein [Candidatus Cetobacterium colombiensis]
MIINFINKIRKYINELQLTHFYTQMKGAFENYKRSNSNLWANTLCYFTTLSFIPVLAIAFSIGRWFGIDNYYLKQLTESSPLNEETVNLILETTQNLLQNTRSGIIAGVGFLSLGWVIVSMFSVIEKALNSIWGIRKTRGVFRKVTDYFIVFLMLPVSVIGANILTNLKIDIFYSKHIIELIAPYLALWIFFIFFYMVLPNTKVSLVPTIWSSFIVSFLLNQSNMLLVRLQIIITTYNKIYGSFSVLLLSLIWLKIVWFLILIGAHFSYILQNRDSLGKIGMIKKINFISKYRVTQKIVVFFVKNYLDNEKATSVVKISEDLKIPMEFTRDIIEMLKKMGYISLIESEVNDEKKYKLTMNIEIITFRKLYEDMENFGENFTTDQINYDENKKITDYIKNI